MDAGDFDETPAPSCRPSLIGLRSDNDGAASPPTRAASVRHHLLKTSTSGPTVVDREFPAPPILSPSLAASDAAVLAQSSAGELENKFPFLPPSQLSTLSNCSHTRIEQAPFVSNAQSGNRSRSFGQSPDSSTRPISPRRGSSSRGLTWQDEARAMVMDQTRASDNASTISQSIGMSPPVPDDDGHGRMSKVRCAFEDNTGQEHVIFNKVYGDGPRLFSSKVGPADAKVDRVAELNPDQARFMSGSSTAVSSTDLGDGYLRDSHVWNSQANSRAIASTLSNDFRRYTSKVVPFSDSPGMPIEASDVSSTNKSFPPHFMTEFPDTGLPEKLQLSPRFAGHMSKVRPYFELEVETDKTQTDESSGDHILLTPKDEVLHVPSAKVKPFVDRIGALNSETSHHHVSKVQAFTQSTSPSAFPRHEVLSECRRCNVPSEAGTHAVEQPGTVSTPREGALRNAYLSTPPVGKHSLSLDVEYPVCAGVKQHTLDACLDRSAMSRQTHKEASQPSTQSSTPRPRVEKTGESSDGNYFSPGDDDSSASEAWTSNGEENTVVKSRADERAAIGPHGLQSTKNAPEFIHAPVPISKVRPHFQEFSYNDHASSLNESHAPTPKVKAVVAESTQSGHCDDDQGLSNWPRQERFEPPKEESPNGSSRSHSLGSILDYRRTAHWLRGVFRHRGSYTTKFTEGPDRVRQDQQQDGQQRRNSESVLPLSRFNFSQGAPSGKLESNFDGHEFRQAVGHLERLLNEAFSVATQAIDVPRRWPETGKSASNSPDAHGQSIRSADDGDADSHVSAPPPGAPKGSDDLQRAEPWEVGSSKRPVYRHAATYSGTARRPRLNEIIENYSNEGSELRSTTNSVNGDVEPSSDAGQSKDKVHRHVPHRRSSKSKAKVDSAATCKTRDKDAKGKSVDSRESGLGRGKEIKMELSPELRSHYDHDRTRPMRSMEPYAMASDADEAVGEGHLPERDIAGRPMHSNHGISLRRRSHISLQGAGGFNLSKSRKRQPIARDWSPVRKRFMASVACISTALVGIILGIYAGIVPSVQYYIIDQSHLTVHGNTGCFLGLALPTFFLWPLPLLHGRKPYILSSLVLAMPLLFPQALAVYSQRLTQTMWWRSLLLASRTIMGVSLGFASMNFHSTLMDLFGASLMGVNPHQEVVDHYDARRHGGGMGVWLGIWTWCWIGSLAVGFLVGATVIDSHPPAWGFYISIMMIAVVLFLNVVCPEVRRSAFRRSVAEVRTGSDISRRLARGEIMMHRVKTGPRWWGQEVYHGVALSLDMVRQPGFAVLALYSAWIYAQVVLIIVLLGSLTSRFYRLRSPHVGLLVGAMALGALLAIPFQKANLFSRSRQRQMNTNLATLNRKVAWSSHLVRRTIFTLLLPLVGICYAAVSSGPPMHVSVPTIFSTAVGFLSCLAIAECNGLVMETFDCSDLSPGMTGRQRSGDGKNLKRTNYSSFPRVSAGFAAIHGLGFVLAAGATALGGLVTRTLGQQVSTGVVAAILLILTVMLLLVLARFTEAQIVPRCKSEEMDRVVEARRRSTVRRASMPNNHEAVMEEERAWQPIMMGNPTGKKRRMNVLELGRLSRWQEIRRRNKLIDSGAHGNRVALERGMEALDDGMNNLQRQFLHVKGKAKRKTSRRPRRGVPATNRANESVEMDVLDVDGGLRARRNVDAECAMSQTMSEDGDNAAPDAGRQRRR